MNSRKPLEGKVIKILNAREIVINLGSQDGVNYGMYFDVLDNDLENICDPETNENLGSIKRSKITLLVAAIGEKLSVLKTFRQIGGGGWGVVAKSFIPLSYETLKKQEEFESISEFNSIVKINDKVVENTLMGNDLEDLDE